jgi:hypothetical protein
MITINAFITLRNSESFRGFEGIDGPTPIGLCDSQINKIPCDYSDPNAKWLFPAVGHGTYAIIVYWRYMNSLSNVFIDKEERSRHILKNMLYLNEINPALCRWLRQDGFINVIEGDYLKYENNMKFDACVGNLPFNKQNGSASDEAIWPKFVEKTFDLVKENGYVSLIHPGGWRNVDGKFKKVQELLKTKKMEYLEIHDEKDGLKTFKAETRYDFYVVKNTSPNNHKTKIKGQDGVVEEVDITNKEFIPNNNITKLYGMVAEEGEETVEIISDSSYHHQRQYMSSIQTEEYIFPCIYTVKKGDVPRIIYSNVNDKGHFGKSKLIWSNGRIISVGSIIDENGDYGLTQYSYGIVENSENLTMLKECFDSQDFRTLMHSCAVSDMSVNRKIIQKKFLERVYK